MSKTRLTCYETFGNPSNPAIVLIMGIGGQLIDWPSTLTQGLADHGFYVITFDNRDTGLSHYYEELGPANFGEAIAAKQEGRVFKPPYTLEDMASDVIKLMDDLHIAKAHILGGSMGGMIAQYVALNFPARVLSLICIATTSGDPHLPPPKKEVLEFFSSSVGETDEQSLEAAIHKKLQLFKIYHHPDYFDEEKVIKQLTVAFQRANYPAGFKRLALATICAESRTDRLTNLNLPCLIIHGDYDPAFSIEHGKQLAACISGSHLEIIKNMGHGFTDYFCKIIVELIVKKIKKD